MSIQKKILPVLFATLMLDMIGTGMVFPIIPIIFTDPTSHSFLLQGYSKGAQFFIAGLVTALFGLMQFIAAPILGELSDIYGRKRLLTVGIAVLAFSNLLFGFGIEIASVALILFSRAVAGIAAANFSIAQAAIADITEPKDRAKNFGLIGAAFGIGFIMGPVLGGWIAGLTANAAAPFWFAGALGVINVIFVTLMLPETRKHIAEQARAFNFLKGIHNIVAAFKDHDARPVYFASFFQMSGFVFLTSFIGVYLVSRFGFDTKTIGIFFSIMGAWVVFTQLIILRVLSGKYNERAILRFSLLGLGSAIGLYPFMGSIHFLYTLMPLLAVSQGLSMANMNALVSKSVGPERQGAALGINGSLIAFAQGVIPLIAGVGSGIIGIKAPFIAGAILVYIGWSILFVFMKR